MRQDGSSDEVVQLVENVDYYMDHGLMVLTSAYHLRRGYCCHQGCRHCPFSEEPTRNEGRDVPGDEESI
jgi:hypothetical protein